MSLYFLLLFSISSCSGDIFLSAYLFQSIGNGLVDIRNEKAFLPLLDVTKSFSAEVLTELRECRPFGGVHVDVISVFDILLIDCIRLDELRAEAVSTQVQKTTEKLLFFWSESER